MLCSSSRVTAATVEEAKAQLDRVPPKDSPVSYTVTLGDGNGWVLQNAHREYLINKKLKECAEISSDVLPKCEEVLVEVPPPPLYQHPLFTFAVASVALMVGYYHGQKR